jgi:hypothetical protein
MAERLAYAILGSGYWAGRMRTILAEKHRVASIQGGRRQPNESSSAYKLRLSQLFEETKSQVAWICIPPGSHIPAMAEAALNAGLHVIAEKPWLCSRSDTQPLLDLASRKKLIFGVHYQYCLLKAIEAWRRDLNSGAGLEFNGCFTVSRVNRLGIDAIDNLGSHLVAIWNYAVPEARVSELTCGYEIADARKVRVEKSGRCVASIDFLENSEPIIQSFVEKVDGAVTGAAVFPFGIDFALRVAESIMALKLRPRDTKFPL